MDIERSGGSGVAWLSQTRTNSVMCPETSSMARATSVDTDSSAIWSDDEVGDEANDRLVLPLQSNSKKPANTKIRRSRLQRAQSERINSVEGKSYDSSYCFNSLDNLAEM